MTASDCVPTASRTRSLATASAPLPIGDAVADAVIAEDMERGKDALADAVAEAVDATERVIARAERSRADRRFFPALHHHCNQPGPREIFPGLGQVAG